VGERRSDPADLEAVLNVEVEQAPLLRRTWPIFTDELSAALDAAATIA
jgi:hypothetical protein